MRKKFLPHTLADICATLFILCIIPITYWFELCIVMPEIFPSGTFWNIFHWICGTFLFFNVIGNWLAVILKDTSIRGKMINLPVDGKSKRWQLCSVCESIAPPRSWHCKTCDVCILKRDHHCIFTGCCIGHHNHRYFMILLFYLFISTAYVSIYNNLFIWFIRGRDFRSWTSVIQMVFPLAWLMVDTSTDQYYMVIYLINMIGALFTGALLYYHGSIVLKGAVVHEHENKMNDYNLGKKKNIEIVLGKRWYLTWLTPFVQSPLMHDGINWDLTLADTEKSKVKMF